MSNNNPSKIQINRAGVRTVLKGQSVEDALDEAVERALAGPTKYKTKKYVSGDRRVVEIYDESKKAIFSEAKHQYLHNLKRKGKLY